MYDKIETPSENNNALPEEQNKCRYEDEEKLLSNPETRGKLSYWKNHGGEPLKNITIGELIAQCAEKFESREAICAIHQGSRLTYKQVYVQIESFAAGLLAIGLKKGDLVGIWAPNTLEWYISLLGIIKAGLVAVNLNPLYEYPELEPCLKKTQIKALIMGDAFVDRSYYDHIKTIIPELSNYNSNDHIESQALPFLKILIVITQTHHKGAYRWCDLLTLPTSYHRQKLQQIEKEINIHDICNVQFTSGTTGTTKGASLTHHNLVNNAYFVGKRMLLMDKHHKICLQVPLFHTFGTVLGVFIAISYGATLVMPSFKFSPTKSIEAVIKEKCTILYGTPTMYIDLITILKRMATTDQSVYSKLTSLEIALTAGSVCAPELFRKMKKYFNFKRIYSGYGMTEVSPIAFFSEPNDSEHLITTTIGNVVDHAEAKVIDDNGRIVPFGTAGEVCFRGYNLMKGYYNDPQATEKGSLEGGWFRSGDKFILLENGYGQVVGRIKDTIIRGGENIEPAEIENVIITHPKVSYVQVYAVSDQRLGEVVAASIVPNENDTLDEEEIRQFCVGKFAAYKIPKYIKFVDDFPRSGTGKIQKYKLRANLEHDLGLKKSEI